METEQLGLQPANRKVAGITGSSLTSWATTPTPGPNFVPEALWGLVHARALSWPQSLHCKRKNPDSLGHPGCGRECGCPGCRSAHPSPCQSFPSSLEPISSWSRRVPQPTPPLSGSPGHPPGALCGCREGLGSPPPNPAQLDRARPRGCSPMPSGKLCAWRGAAAFSKGLWEKLASALLGSAAPGN